MDKYELLAGVLEMAVPLWQTELAGRSAEDLQRMATDCCERICMADSLMGKATGERPGKCAEDFNAVARGIAILSMAPGGIKVFGRHWQWVGPTGLNPNMPQISAGGLADALNRLLPET